MLRHFEISLKNTKCSMPKRIEIDPRGIEQSNIFEMYSRVYCLFAVNAICYDSIGLNT